jgi:hypothetical protein
VRQPASCFSFSIFAHCERQIAPSGLFWVIAIPEGKLVISPDGETATLATANIPVVKFPAIDAESTPAILSFRMIVKATDGKILYNDPRKQFRVGGYGATVPSIGFSWKSDPVSTSKANFRTHRGGGEWPILQSAKIVCVFAER